MAQITDQTTGTTPDGAEDSRAAVARILVAVAEDLTANEPTAPLTAFALLVSVSVQGYEEADRSVFGDAAALSRAAQAAAPKYAGGITRGEYALLLRRAAKSLGYEWGDDDDKPAIPKIPGPRRGVALVASAPSCCGRDMGRDGSQWVCGKCGAYTGSSSVASAASAHLVVC